MFRLRVEMKLAEFDLEQQSLSQSQMPQLLDGIVSRLLARGLRVLLLFNSVRDASEASKLLSSRFSVYLLYWYKCTHTDA